MTFDELLVWLEALLEESIDATPTSAISLDSLEYIIVLDALDTELGVDVPLRLLPSLQTYGDLYHHCELRWAQDASARGLTRHA